MPQRAVSNLPYMLALISRPVVTVSPALIQRVSTWTILPEASRMKLLVKEA